MNDLHYQIKQWTLYFEQLTKSIDLTMPSDCLCAFSSSKKTGFSTELLIFYKLFIYILI